jgi:hypothetical protein
MGQRSEKLRDLPFEDIKAHPEIITDILSSDDSVSVILERRGDTVRFAAMRSYDSDAHRILEKARENHRQRESLGYTRDDAFADLEAVQSELKRIQKTG